MENSAKVSKTLTEVVAEIVEALHGNDLDLLRGLLLYLQILVMNNPKERLDGIILRLMKELKGDRVAMMKPVLIETFGVVKYLALVNMHHNSLTDQFQSAKSEFHDSLTNFKQIFYRQPTDSNDLFWNIRGLHSVCVCEELFQASFKYTIPETKLSSLLPTWGGECIVHLLRAAGGDPVSIGWLLNQGFTTVYQLAQKSRESRRQRKLLSIETFNIVVLNHQALSMEQAATIAFQLMHVFNTEIQDIRDISDWIWIHSILDVLMNILSRFHHKNLEPIHQAVISFFESKLPVLLKFGLFGWITISWNDGKMLFKERLQARIIECIASIASWTTFEEVEKRCRTILQKFGNNYIQSKLYPNLGWVASGVPPPGTLTNPQGGVFHLLNKVQDVALDLMQLHGDEFDLHFVGSNETVTDKLLSSLREKFNDQNCQLVSLISSNTVFSINQVWYCLVRFIAIQRLFTQRSEELKKLSEDMFSSNNATFDATSSTSTANVAFTDLHPAVVALLHDPTGNIARSMSVEDSIACIRSIASVGKANMANFENQNLLIVLGPSGAGKSTTINWLYGCTMIEDEDGNILVSPDSEKSEVTTIGSNATFSTTVIPKFVTLESDDNLVVCDAPGYCDSRGAQIAIGNAINIWNAVRQSRTCRFFLLLSADNFMSNKADTVKSSMRALQEMVGGLSSFNEISSSIRVGITNVDTSQRNKKVMKLYKDICSNFNYNLIESEPYLVDPLQKYEGMSRDELIKDVLLQIPTIPNTQLSSMIKSVQLDEKEQFLLGQINVYGFD
jgi:energy-coupling factor transporter ATP-binding protein EcfA2